MKSVNGNFIRPTARYTWWLKKSTYLRYMMRELSSLFIGAFSVMMVWGLYQLSQGEAVYTAWLNGLWSNWLPLSVLMFVFAVYHSFTWFLVTPKAMPLKISGRRIPGSVIIVAHLMLWLFCSILIWMLFVDGGGI